MAAFLIPLAGGLIRRGISALVRRGASAAGRRVIAGTIKAAAGTVAATTAITIAGRGIDRFQGRFDPPGFGPGGFQGTPRPRPREGIVGRTVSRIIPGGKTGREFTPVNDMTDRVGRPIAVYPETTEQTRGPSGYVVVTMPSTGEKVAMLRHFAIRAGLYNAPPKPPVSGYDMRAINRANSARKRVKRLATKVGFVCATKGRRAVEYVTKGKK